MSITKRLIESISTQANELSSQLDNITWYEALEKATLNITNRHFCELNPYIRTELQRSPKDLEIAINHLAKIQKKRESITLSEAKRKACVKFGLKEADLKTLKKEQQDDISNEHERISHLEKLSGRKLITTLKDYMDLALIKDPQTLLGSEALVQFDYLLVDDKVIEQQQFYPEYAFHDGRGIFPYAVLKENGKMINYRIPVEHAPLIMNEIQSMLIEG